jgi:peptidoglycan hydrolase-like protein with peptidoglycan-binding domain
MRKLAIATALALLLATPLATSALSIDLQSQINDLLSQIKTLQVKLTSLLQFQHASSTAPTGTSTSSICMSIPTRTLSVGAQGEDVTNLQQYLSDQGFLSASATGYFGSITSNAVARWQSAQGISAAGSFGPLSRERIKIWCNNGGTSATTACSTGNTPVCARSRCTTSCPAGTICDAQCPLQTYSNRCTMSVGSATFIHEGACTSTEPTTTNNKSNYMGACGDEYAPVCGQPGCATSCPAGQTCNALCAPQTFNNQCKLTAAGAKLLYQGQCTATILSPEYTPSCKEWTDGCNTWSREVSGGAKTQMTQRYCDMAYATWKCTAYFTTTN